MKLIFNGFKHNGLFIIMFLITVIIIITVSISITWTTIRMSEQFFIKKFSITNSKVMNQMKDSFESFHYSVVIASNNLLQSSTVRKTLTEKNESNAAMMGSIFNMYQQMKSIKSNLDTYNAGIVVMGKNGISYATDRSYWPVSDKELRSNLMTRNILEHPKKLMYQYDRLPKQNAAKDRNFIVATRGLMDRITGTVYGSMYIAFAESEFRKFYSNYTSPGNHVFLVNKSGVIVSSSIENRIGTSANDLLHYAEKMEHNSKKYLLARFMNKEQIILMEYLPSFDLYMFNIIDKQTAIGDLIDKKEIALISMTIVFAALIIVFLISRKVTDSLSSLVKQISNASKYNFHQYVSVSGTYETRQIGRAFNSMLDELHEYVDQLVKAQKDRRNAELAALQQQINPHFLYNTLTTIKFMVQQGEREESEATINALISLLQNTIGTISETITVNQEVENLKSYVFINQKRYGNRIKVNYFIAPDCLDYRIPKLILQPFLENAFFHGFNLKASGYINVLVWREGNELICEVVDNGDGMEIGIEGKLPKTKRNRQLFSGIGVKNVHDRIQLIYGESYGVKIASKLGEGTKVRMNLPIRKK